MPPKKQLNPSLSKMFAAEEEPEPQASPVGKFKKLMTGGGSSGRDVDDDAQSTPNSPVSGLKKIFALGGSTKKPPPAKKAPQKPPAAGGARTVGSTESLDAMISPRKEELSARTPAKRDSYRSPATRLELLDKTMHMEEASQKKQDFWAILLTTAVCQSILSFVIDQFTARVGTMRAQYTHVSNGQSLLGVMLFNMMLTLLARLIVRTTVEAEGSGFPEMKAMLFGKVLDHYLTRRVLAVKATCLALVVGAGLPIGKEGPNVHMAACISRTINAKYFSVGKKSRLGVMNINKLFIAACATGVGASFSAPIAGVVFALELMLPQLYDTTGYRGCFVSAVLGSIVYETMRTWSAAHAEKLLPLVSTNIYNSEGASSKYPLCRLSLDVILGCLCGLLGGLWIKMHAKTAGKLKAWRMKGAPTPPPKASGGKTTPLLAGEDQYQESWLTAALRVWFGDSFFQWRDLFQVCVVVILNTYFAGLLPLLGGKPQPMLMSNLFDKNLMQQQSQWSSELFGPTLTIFFCLCVKWVFTILALSMPIPTGVVAPTMIIGALIGRFFVLLIPEEIRDWLIADPRYPGITDEDRGAFMARFAIIGASAFCAAVVRAFAMAITLFEVLMLPGSVLPLCCATLAAILTANMVSLPFFDQNLAGRGMGGIAALTSTEKANMPAFDFMIKIDVATQCLPRRASMQEIQNILAQPSLRIIAIVKYTNDGALLLACITRENLQSVVHMWEDMKGGEVVDLCDPAFQRPHKNMDALVEGCPTHVEPTMSLEDVYIIMKTVRSGKGDLDHHVFIVWEGFLLGIITLGDVIQNIKA